MNIVRESDPSLWSQSASGTIYRWRVLGATFITYFVQSYVLIVLAIAMPVLLKVLNISLPQGGLLGSATMIGAILGSILFGLIAENRGRRFALILVLIWLGVAMGLVYLAKTWGQWMVLRFVTGLAIGGVWGPNAALIATHWAPQYRARAASFMLSSFAVGAVFASFVGWVVLGLDWRLLFFIGTASVLLSWAVARLVPPDEALAPAPSSPEGRMAVGIGAIFIPSLIRTTVLCALVSFTLLAGYWGAAFWIPTFLTKERGLSLTMMANFSLVMYVGMFIGFQFFGVLADRIGRRRVIILAFISVAAAVALYLVVPHPLFLFWWGIVVGIGLSGGSGVMGAYFAELFPERVRAYASGFCWNVGRIGAVLAPYTIGYVGKVYGLQTGLAITCIINLLGAMILLFMPETFHRKAKSG